MNIYFQLGLTIAVVLFIFGIAKMNGYPIEYDNPVMRTARAAMFLLLGMGCAHWIWS